MAIFHLHIGIVKRGAGKSAVAAAAYRSGECITNERDGETHDFTHKRGIAYTEIMLPTHAPQEYANRGVLWNSVERAEKAYNAQLARDIELSLPQDATNAKLRQINARLKKLETWKADIITAPPTLYEVFAAMTDKTNLRYNSQKIANLKKMSQMLIFFGERGIET
jgi:hypothetical protein